MSAVEYLARVLTPREDTFTDFVIGVDGTPTDTQWEDLLAVAGAWATRHDLGDLAFGSHRCNDDGLTFHALLSQRDAIAAALQAVLALAERLDTPPGPTVYTCDVAVVRREVAHEVASRIRATIATAWGVTP